MGRKAKSRKRTPEEKLTDSEEEQMIRTIEHLATFCRLAKDHGEQMSATVLAVFSSDDPDKVEKNWRFLDEETRKLSIEVTKKTQKRLAKTHGEQRAAQVVFLTAIRLLAVFIDDGLVFALDDTVKKGRDKLNKHKLDYAQ